MTMGEVDALTGTFRLPCPTHGVARVRLSAFRQIDRLAGPAHPAVYRVAFECACGDEHVALVGQDALDRAPLGLDDETGFVNLMTSRRDDVASELAALASAHIGRGEWPWSFFCYPEAASRPVTPSSFRLLTPCAADVHRGPYAETVGVAIHCPVCDSTSINLVTRPHVDVPFHSDATIGVVNHVFEHDALRTIDEFRAALGSASFDEKRLLLDG
jgi:hypothetical protein